MWATLTPEQESDARTKIVQRLNVTTVTIYNYYKGNTRPTSMLVKKELANIMREVTGLQTSAWLLFPDS